jgi:hypothetical protein
MPNSVTQVESLPPVSSPQAAAVVRNAFIAMGASGPRTLISVYPLELSLELRHEGTKTYVMAAAPPDGYSQLVVDDTFASVKNFTSGQLYPAPVPAAAVADNLVNSWTKGRVGSADGLGPGVLVCAGTVPQPAEIAEAKARQTNYFRSLVNDADIKFTKEGAVNITDDHRLAAKWMGVKDRKWAQPMIPKSLVQCPACREEVYSEAILCKHCHTNIPEFLASQQSKQAEVEQISVQETGKKTR